MTFAQLMDHAREIEESGRTAAMERDLMLGQPSLRWTLSGDYRAKFDGVVEMFRPFADLPDPTKLDPMIDALHKAVTMLSHGHPSGDATQPLSRMANPDLQMSSIDSCLERWTGRAAMEFKRLFIDKFPAIVANQFLIAVALRWALEANREIWVRARNDIDTIAHKTIAALDRMDDCGKNEWTVTFSVIAAAAAVAALPVSGGALLAITVAGATAQVAASTIPDDPPSVGFSGESAEAVIGEMREAIGFLAKGIHDQEMRICRTLDSAFEVVNHHRDVFVSRRPALADATAATVTNPEYMGYSR